MGCAPSIHVSQSTGVVYCREDNLRTVKQSRTTSLSISEVVSHIPQNQSDSVITETRALRIDKERESSYSVRAAPWSEAETQTLEMQQSAGMEVKVPLLWLHFYPLFPNGITLRTHCSNLSFIPKWMYQKYLSYHCTSSVWFREYRIQVLGRVIRSMLFWFNS